MDKEAIEFLTRLAGNVLCNLTNDFCARHHWKVKTTDPTYRRMQESVKQQTERVLHAAKRGLITEYEAVRMITEVSW